MINGIRAPLPSSPTSTSRLLPPPPPSVNLDVIPGQIGSAILRASDGTIVQGPMGRLTTRDVDIVYQIMLEIGTLLLEAGGGGREGGCCRGVMVGFQNVMYNVALDGECFYIVKKKSSP